MNLSIRCFRFFCSSYTFFKSFMLYATLSLTQYSHQIFDTFVHRNYSICYVFSVMCSFCRPQFNAYACMYRYVNKMYSNGLDHGRVMTRSAKMHTHTHSPQAPNRFKTHWTLAMFLFLGRFLWPKIGCSAFVGWILKVAGGERWRVSILCRGCSLVFVVMFAHWMLKWPIYMP